MVWDSIPLMTLLDILIGAIAVAAVLLLRREADLLDALGLGVARRVVAVGVGAIGLFYFADLATMWALPVFIPQQRAMAFMETLHREYSWWLMLGVASSLGVGTHVALSALRANESLSEQIDCCREADHLAEKWLADSQNVAKIGSYVLDIAAETWRCSPALERILGIGPDYSHTVQEWRSLLHPDERDKVMTYLTEHVLAKRQRFDMDYRIIRRSDGAERWVHGLGEMELDEEGPPLKLLGTVQDITDRKLVERTLLLTQLAVDKGVDPTYWVHEDGQVGYANDAACRELGYSREELLSMSVPEFDPDFPHEKWPEHWQAMKQAGSSRFEAHHRTKEGVVFPVEIHTNFFVHEDKEYIWAYARDITERVKAQTLVQQMNRSLEQRVAERTVELKAARDEFQRIFELSPDMIGIMGFDGNYRRVNPAFSHTLGYSEEELLNKNYLELVHPADKEAMLADAQAQSEAGADIIRVEVRYLHKNGSSKWLRWRARLDHEQELAYGTAKDVTAEREAAETLRRHREELEEVVADTTADLQMGYEQQAAAAALGERALAGLAPGDIMREAVAVAAEGLGADSVGILQLLPGGTHSVLCAGVGWAAGMAGSARLATRADSMARYTLGSDEAVVMEDIDTETRFEPSTLVREHGAVAGVSVIIHGRETPFGVMGVFYNQRRTTSQREVDFVQLIANVIGDSVGRQRAEDELARSARMLRELAERLRRVREDERIALSRELHDELGQALTCIRIDLGWMTSKLDNTSAEVQERVSAAAELIGDTIGLVQRISSDLRPPALDDLGLLAAVAWHLESFGERNAIEASAELQEGLPELTPDAATAVFRIVQEALTNVVRHAEAARVLVAIGVRGDDLEVRVIDDGIGISVDEIGAERSLGLLGMSERAASFEGNLELGRRAEGGTELIVTLPLHNCSTRVEA